MQIIFSNHKGSVVSKLIMHMTNSNISHASIRFGRTESSWMVEATGKGVYPGWWNHFTKTSNVVHAFEVKGVDEEKLEKLVDECLDDMIGKSYDFRGIIGFAIAILLKYLGCKKIRNIFGSEKLYFCSEFVMRIAKKIQEKFGVIVFVGDPELMSPYDLFTQCLNNKYLDDKSLEYTI